MTDSAVPARYTARSYAAVRFLAQRALMKPAVWTQSRVTVLGRDRIGGLDGPFIVVANHLSHLDAPLIFGALPARLCRHLAAGAAADYFFDVPWRRALTALFFNAFPVHRTGQKPDARSVSASALLRNGLPVLIFPEGSRSRDGRTAPFRTGAARLAIEAGLPCLPVAVVGTDLAQPPGRNWPRFGRPAVGVAFGDPLYPPPGAGPAAFTDRLQAEVTRLKTASAPRILRAPEL